MKPEKTEPTKPINSQEERELEDQQFLLAVGIKVGCGYELLKMLREENGLQSKSEKNQ